MSAARPARFGYALGERQVPFSVGASRRPNRPAPALASTAIASAATATAITTITTITAAATVATTTTATAATETRNIPKRRKPAPTLESVGAGSSSSRDRGIKPRGPAQPVHYVRGTSTIS